VIVIAIAVGALGIWKGSFAVGDGDAFGYVSEATLIARGSLHIEQQFVRTLPWPFADWTFAPAGYRPATLRGFIVPTYPVGLPLFMALFQRLAGPGAVFYVVPQFGAIGVLATAWLGASVHSRLTGTLASLVYATSASFLFQLMLPMSDVPAAACWTLALVLTIRHSPLAGFGAGVAVSVAVLIRPNLVPLAAVVGLFLTWRAIRDRKDHSSAVRVALFAFGALPGPLVIAAINHQLFGSALNSGYEPLSSLYMIKNVGPNLDRFPRWLLQTQTPFIWVGLAAPLFASARRSIAFRPALQSDHVALLLLFAGTTCLSYLFYRPFGRDEWTYLRFLLPAYPALLVLAVAVTHEVAGGVSSRPWAATFAVLAICLVLSGWLARESFRRGVFNLREVERRYIDVGSYIRTALPADSVFIANLHAGSIRYYAGRLTMNASWLERRWLDPAIKELSARGYHVFIVLEEGEEDEFKQRFSALNAAGRLDWPPIAERPEPVKVRIYDSADRYLFEPATRRVVTQRIGRAGH